MPVLVGAIFKQTGNKPPGMVRKKGDTGLVDMARNRRFFDVPIRGPLASFLTPQFNTAACMRLLTAALSHQVGRCSGFAPPGCAPLLRATELRRRSSGVRTGV
jgi:2-hydroxychromene-2-carboxylate isomerase